MFGAAECGAQVAQKPAVYPHNTGLYLLSHADGAAAVFGPDGGGQAVAGVVGQRNGFFFAIEGADVAAGAEDFFAHHAGIVGEAGPDGGRNPCAFIECGTHIGHAAADFHGSALFFRKPVIRQHFFAVLKAYQGTEIGFRIIGAAGLELGGFFFHAAQKGVKKRPLHIDALGAEAHLAAVDKRRAHAAFHRFFQIAVGKHNGRVFAAAFERNIAQAHRCGLHDDFAGAGFAGEGDGVDARMGGEESAGRIGAEAVHHVKHARRHAAFVHHFAKQRGGGGGFFRWLHHHGVAAGERGAHFPGHQQQGQVPR